MTHHFLAANVLSVFMIVLLGGCDRLVAATAPAITDGAAQYDAWERARWAKCRTAVPPALNQADVVIAASFVNELNPPQHLYMDTITVFDGKSFRTAKGDEMRAVSTLISGRSGRAVRVTAELNESVKLSDCLWTAKSAAEHPVKDFDLWTTRPLQFNFAITPADQATLATWFPECVVPDGPPGAAAPRCVRLLATSDLDGNGRREFWFVSPSLWFSDGVAMAEEPGPSAFGSY